MIWPWQDRKRAFSPLKVGTFALMLAPAVWLVYQVETEQFGPVPLGGMTYWSGLWATALLLLALAITPASTIFRWSRLILVRRLIGVTALAYTIAHIVIYFALRFWSFASIAHEMVTRISLIVATIATIGLIALGATSLDAAVQRMGAQGWNRLHNTIYVLTALALLHYLLSPAVYPEQFLLSGMFFWLMAWRWLNRLGAFSGKSLPSGFDPRVDTGFPQKMRPLQGSGWGADVGALALLAVASCLFTALIEAGWVWAYHGYQPSGTLANNFSLELGVPPAWQILALGLLIALAAFARQALRPGAARLDARKIG